GPSVRAGGQGEPRPFRQCWREFVRSRLAAAIPSLQRVKMKNDDTVILSIIAPPDPGPTARSRPLGIVSSGDLQLATLKPPVETLMHLRIDIAALVSLQTAYTPSIVCAPPSPLL